MTLSPVYIEQSGGVVTILNNLVAVDVVVYFRISNATISVTNVEDSSRSTKLLAQTTLRNILGTKTLAEMLSDREQISLQMQATFVFERFHLAAYKRQNFGLGL